MTAVDATHRSRLPVWWVVAAAGAIAAISLGVRSTFGLLVEPIAVGLDSELGAISLAIAVQNLMWGFSQPIAGALSDRYGAPRILAAGGLLYALAMLLMSTAQGSGMILLSGGFITGIAIGAASFAVVLSAVGRIAPPEKRSLMLGVVSATGSLGQFVLIPVTRVLLDRGSWESTAVAMALVLLPIIALAPALRSMLLSLEPGAGPVEAPRTLRRELRRAASSRSYFMLNAAFFVCGFHVTFIGIHLAGYASLQGVADSSASNSLALIGLFNVFGSLLVGWLGGRFSFTWILAAIYGLRAVVIAVYLLVPISGTSTVVFGMAIGVLWLATVPMTSGIVTQQFGTTHAGALFGIVFLSHQVGSFIGAWLGGALVDAMGSYTVMWWLSVALGIFAMALHLLIDESPVPEPPVDSGGLRLAPAGAVIVVLAAGVAAAISLARPAQASESTRTAQPAPAAYCVLGPTLHRG
ncbi:MAG: MFS transporter [Acidimicrobiales bacterium]